MRGRRGVARVRQSVRAFCLCTAMTLLLIMVGTRSPSVDPRSSGDGLV